MEDSQPLSGKPTTLIRSDFLASPIELATDVVGFYLLFFSLVIALSGFVGAILPVIGAFSGGQIDSDQSPMFSIRLVVFIVVLAIMLVFASLIWKLGKSIILRSRRGLIAGSVVVIAFALVYLVIGIFWSYPVFSSEIESSIYLFRAVFTVQGVGGLLLGVCCVLAVKKPYMWSKNEPQQ